MIRLSLIVILLMSVFTSYGQITQDIVLKFGELKEHEYGFVYISFRTKCKNPVNFKVTDLLTGQVVNFTKKVKGGHNYDWCKKFGVGVDRYGKAKLKIEVSGKEHMFSQDSDLAIGMRTEDGHDSNYTDTVINIEGVIRNKCGTDPNHPEDCDKKAVNPDGVKHPSN
jgi:hypothetical protein